MTIKQFDRPTCRMVAARIEAALADLGAELGCTIAYRGGTISDQSFMCKIECTIEGGMDLRADRAKQAFDMLAALYGFKRDDYGREFNHPTFGRCTIAGIKDRARSMPLLFKRLSDGKVYKSAAEPVLRYLNGGL